MDPAEVTAWLDYSLAELVERRLVVEAALREMLAAHPTVAEDDTATAGLFVENLKLAKALETSAKAEIDKIKRPFLDAGRAVDGWRGKYMEALARPVSWARGVLLDLEQRKAATARRLAQEQAQEAARKAQEAAAAAEAARVRDGLFSAATDVYEEERRIAAQQAEAARRLADAKPAVLSNSRGQYGGQASITTRWTWQVKDIAQVPLEFLQVNEAMLDAVAKKRDPVTGRPTRDVPGIEWVPQYSLGVR
jgi:hypothetical protein